MTSPDPGPAPEPVPLTTIELRQQAFATMGDLAQGHGLEVGPLSAALTSKSTSDVTFVDVEDRETLVARYELDPGVDTALIPEIDFALHAGDRYLTLAEAASPRAPYDWIVASHVVEHVPDLVGWLRDVTTLLRQDGGQLLLVVPDRRFTFDLLRPLTSVGQMVEAHDRGDRTPSVRAVLDHFSSLTTIDAGAVWAGTQPARPEPDHALADALTQVEIARSGAYVDTHVWVFEPRSFVLAMDCLARMGLVDLRVASLLPTAPNTLEFYVALEPVDPSLTVDARNALLSAAREEALAVVERAPLPPSPDPAPDQDALREALTRLGSDRERLQATVTDLQDELHRLRVEHHAVMSSTRWRVGGLVVGPAARVRARVSRGPS